MTTQRTIAHQPALDGLRAIAVAMVLAFHGGFRWMHGGYVGVSLFFTLSGYLITTLLLVEHDRTGTIGLAAFYTRRMKRLLPASTLCLVAVLIATAAGQFDYVTTMRRDMLGALFQVFNWVKLLGDASYAELTNATLGRVAPLEHYWSLAIEEQFYWIWPLVVLGLMRAFPRRQTVTVAVVVLAGIASSWAPLVAAVWGPDAAYWATPARMGEILVGAALAAVLLGRTPPRWSVIAAPVGLAVVVWAAVTWPAGRGPAYEGWMPAFAVASAALIWGLQVGSPLRSALSWRPLVWLGTVSYGVYLYHWPVFAVLTPNRASLDGVTLFALRIAVTVVAAALSSALLELPIRRWAPHWRPVVLTAAVTTVAVALSVVVVVEPPSTAGFEHAGDAAPSIEPVDGSLAPLQVVTSTSSPAAPTTGPAAVPASTPEASSPATIAPVPVPAVSRPVRIIVLGDSTAQATATGLVDWATDHPESAEVIVAAAPGCGMLRGGTVPTDGAIDWAGPCDRLIDDELAPMLASLQPDVAMVMVTMRDVEDHRWTEDEGVLTPFDERFRARLLDDYRTMTAALADAGVDRVVWVLPPRPISPFDGPQRPMRDPARYEVQHDVIRDVAEERPDVARVLDMNGWLDGMGRSLDATIRPDGLHWTAEASRWVSDVYLAGSLVSFAVS